MPKLPQRYKYRLIFAVSTAMVYVIKALEIDISGFIIGGIITLSCIMFDRFEEKMKKRNS